MKTIAVDLDGVIYDIIQHIIDRQLPHLEKLRPTNWECYPELGITKEDFFDYYTDCWTEAANYPDIGNKYTNPYAKRLFEYLQNKTDVRTSIITKRSKYDIPNTIAYLLQQDFHFDTFTVITDKQDKLKENFDIIIEDNPKNIPIYGQTGILLTQAWNKEYQITGANKRAKDLKEVITILRRLLPS